MGRISEPVDKTVRFSIRRALVYSHVAAVAIAIFLLGFLDNAFRALWPLVYRAVTYVFTAVAILDIPYFAFEIQDRLNLISSFAYLYAAIIGLAAAWILAKWVYGVGPLRVLCECGSRFIKRINA